MSDACKYPHVMVDLETLGLGTDCVIVQVGAVAFDPVRGDLGPEFNHHVKMGQDGRHVDPSTVLFWMEQEEARKAFVQGQRGALHLDSVLDRFYTWLLAVAADDFRIWAHGPLFDVAILEHAYRSCTGRHPTVPWKYRAPRCTRTLFDLVGADPAKAADELAGPRPVGQDLHVAVADARHQARAVIAAYKKLGLNRCRHGFEPSACPDSNCGKGDVPAASKGWHNCSTCGHTYGDHSASYADARSITCDKCACKHFTEAL